MKAIAIVAGCITALSVAGAVHAQTEAAGVDAPASEQAGTSDFSVSRVEADSPPENEKIWHFTIAPYVIFPFMNGSLTLANQTVDVDLKTGDILKGLNWALMLYFEATHPKFAIATDLLYMNLGQGGSFR